jgi:hypothetical protein
MVEGGFYHSLPGCQNWSGGVQFSTRVAMKILRLFTLLVLVALVLAGTVSVQAQTASSRYFPQTGHTVQGDFLRYFESHGGLEIFGYPLTIQFIENGRLVQYFQKARLEAHPENPAPSQVQIGTLGAEIGFSTAPILPADIPPANDPHRRYFPQTGHTVALAFLEYFDQHGGVEVFGYPLTEFTSENKRIIQDFQKARMEWYPELPPNQRVQLGRLGEIYATTRLDSQYLQPNPAAFNNDVQQITALRARASVRQAITGPTGQQTLYVYVVDQRGKPVQGVSLTAVVRSAAGEKSVPLSSTDPNGYADVQFDFDRAAPGQMIVIHVSAAWARVATGTRTSFLVWW